MYDAGWQERAREPAETAAAKGGSGPVPPKNGAPICPGESMRVRSFSGERRAPSDSMQATGANSRSFFRAPLTLHPTSYRRSSLCRRQLVGCGQGLRHTASAPRRWTEYVAGAMPTGKAAKLPSNIGR
jgi:hypothetical protein